VIGSLKGEAIKLFKRPANWVLVVILLAALATIAYAVTYAVYSHPPPNFRTNVPTALLKRSVFPENVVPTVLQSLNGLGAAIMLILGSLSMGSEYSWQTLQTLFIQRPRRNVVFLGKLVGLAVTCLLIDVLLFAVGAAMALLFVTVDGNHSNWPSVETILRGLAAGWLGLAVWTAFGVVLAVLFRGVAAAIGGGLTYLFVLEGLIAGLLRDTGGIRDALKFLPGVSQSAVTASFRTTFPGLQGPALISATRGTITLLIYLTVFVVIAGVVLELRDVKS
jgi:ABC-type transport system involved in multi-copper enzyme maturation permease subunit